MNTITREKRERKKTKNLPRYFFSHVPRPWKNGQ
jgi:hypothetical protein